MSRLFPILALSFYWLLANVSAADWPEFLGPTRNAISSETNLIKSWSSSGPPLVWEKEIGTGYSAPSLLSNRLVLFHRVGDQEVIEALNALTGKPAWKHSYPTKFIDPFGYNNGPRGSPLLSSNRCFTFGAEGRLVCLALDSGKLIWERNTAADWTVPEAFFGVGSSPVLEGRLLLVMVGGQTNSGMVALDSETGKTVWESVGQKNWENAPMLGWVGDRKVQWKKFDKQASYATPVLATIHGRRIALCLMRQGLVGLDPASGEVLFSRWFRAQVDESVNAANPVVVGNRVLFSSAYYRSGAVVIEINPDCRSFKEIWKGLSLELHWTTPVHHQGFVYAFSGRNEPDARFKCVEFDTGTIAWDRDESWRKTTKQPDVYGRGSAILADGRLIVLGEGGLLGMFKLNPKTAEEICRFQAPQLHYPCWAGPILANGLLFLRSENRLLCYDLRAK